MLATLQSLKNALNIQGTSEDEVLQDILDRSEAIAKRVMGRNVEAADYEEETDGHGEHILALRNFPVISVASVEFLENGTWVVTDQKTYNVSKRTGEIRFPIAFVPRGFANVRVRYRA